MRFVIFLIASLFVQASNNEIQTTRMIKQLDALQESMSRYDGTEESIRDLAQDLTEGINRLTTFNIQALGKIYQDYPVNDADEFFGNTVRFETKNLEDAIGGVDKWADQLKNAKKDSNTEKIKTAEENFSLSMEFLKYVLTGQKSDSLEGKLPEEIEKKLKNFEEMKDNSQFSDLFWVGTTPTLSERIIEEINNYPWLSVKDDREYVIEELRDRLKDLNETEFNFGILEDTADEKGLHEYRREIRWFNIQVQNLNGTVNYHDKISDNPPACPNDELATLPKVDAKYSTLPDSPFPEEKVCGISRCLFYKLTEIVAQVGDIKDIVEELEFKNDLHNKTPEKYKDQVQDIYDDMKDLDVLNLLRDELKQCVEDKKGKGKKKD